MIRSFLKVTQFGRECVANRCLSQKLTQREMAEIEDAVQRSIKGIKDPLLGRPLGRLSFVKRVSLADNQLNIDLQVPPLHPSLTQIQTMVKQCAKQNLMHNQTQKQLNFSVCVKTSPTPPVPVTKDHNKEEIELEGLSEVAHFVAVYSCKGGVGKSTAAIRLAQTLSQRKIRVGILDADIYGPSLPHLVSPEDTTVRASSEDRILPIDHKGLKILSLGYVSKLSGVPGSGPDNGATVLRGPLAGRVVTQLLKGTDWGQLDVLILDMPPGTGDVQLTVGQEITLSGAVAVTTPSTLATQDTLKGLQLLQAIGVDTLAVVENMAYFKCPGGSVHYPMGRGKVNEVLQIESSKVVPVAMSEHFQGTAEDDLPVEHQEAFNKLADIVSAELVTRQYALSQGNQTVEIEGRQYSVSDLRLEQHGDDCFWVRLFSEDGATQVAVTARQLRATDPKTGDELKDSPYQDQRLRVKVTSVTSKGNNGYGVEFADGIYVVYSLRNLAKAALVANSHEQPSDGPVVYKHRT